MKPVHTDFRPVAKDGHCSITGSGEYRFQRCAFFLAEGTQYMIDDITSTSRTPDADTQAGEIPTAQGIHN